MTVGDRKRSPTVMSDAEQRSGAPYDTSAHDQEAP
jgi:hypothetical protein